MNAAKFNAVDIALVQALVRETMLREALESLVEWSQDLAGDTDQPEDGRFVGAIKKAKRVLAETKEGEG